MKNLLFACCLLALFACSEKKTATQEKNTNSSKTATEPEPPVAPLSDGQTTGKRAPNNADKWLYEKTIDEEGRTVYKASTTSPNLLEFEFPYAGGSTATLTLRKRENDIHLYVQVSKGQFNRSFQGGSARIWFDANPPVVYSLLAAENGSANIIFFDSEQAIIRQLKTSQKMVVELEFAGQGKRRIEFRTANLTWNH